MVSRALAAVQPAADSSGIFQPASVHGWVKKRGVLNPVHWHDDFEAQRKAGFKAWVQSWMEQQELGEMPDPPPVLSPARCQISVVSMAGGAYERFAVALYSIDATPEGQR